MVLFRECDFRGRKLLFDSTAIKKIPINSTLETEDFGTDKKDHKGTFAEISNGFGYMVRIFTFQLNSFIDVCLVSVS